MTASHTLMEDITNLLGLGKRRPNDPQVQESEKRLKIVAFTLAELDKAGKEKYPDLVFATCTKVDGAGALTCCRKDMYNHPPLAWLVGFRLL